MKFLVSLVHRYNSLNVYKRPFYILHNDISMLVLYIYLLLFQADVEISFSIPIATLEQAEVLDSSWSNSQELCRQNASSANSTGVGPFGLLVLASNNIEEYTAVFFRIFKKNDTFVVLMGCDQKRYLLNSS